ncbi:MAG: CoA-binding protein [Planctomycetota bacterium]|nr:MAG: CoA-binding protein [Planctomycetota bacterium]
MEKNIDSLIENFLQIQTIAVVGATNKTEKWGYKVFTTLQKHGYNAIPIHPTLSEIQKIKVYPNLTKACQEHHIEGVSLIVPPSVALEVIQECHQHGIQHIWLQPGVESQEILQWANQHSLPLIYQRCILKELEKRHTTST